MYPVAQGVCEVIAVYMEVARPLWKEVFHSHLLCMKRQGLWITYTNTL